MWGSGLTPRAPEAEARSCCPRGLIKHSRRLQNKTGRPLDRAGQGEAVFATFSVTYLGVLGQAVWLQVARFLLIGASKLLQGLREPWLGKSRLSPITYRVDAVYHPALLLLDKKAMWQGGTAAGSNGGKELKSAWASAFQIQHCRF